MVSKAKYKREHKEAQKQHQTKDDDGELKDQCQVEEKQSFHTHGRSFKNVLLGKQEEDEHVENKEPRLPIVKGNVDVNMLEKLQRSIVRESTFPLNIEQMAPKLFSDWHTLMEVKILGSYKLVLTFDSIENMEEAVQSAFLLNHFGEIRKWNEDESNRSRKAWLDIYGMPLRVWNEDNFQKVAAGWGKVIAIDENSLKELNQLKTEVFVKETNHLEKELDADFVKNAEKSKTCGPNDVEILPFEEIAGNCEKSISTRCIVNDRRSEDLIKETQMTASFGRNMKGPNQHNLEVEGLEVEKFKHSIFSRF
ncbi:hypothetical protein PIB30_035221 [Stylosanthes scabra]|uniref:DUF4283 domain-containing protein n=1 Tax=Stylosanthes scabra TaxID=79078 RepID=A0ABU6TDB6_9FABA|nr:hypothetical protein [Stylosanthes scabra]